MTLASLWSQPPATPWPTDEWKSADPPKSLMDALRPQLETAFGPERNQRLGETAALLVIQEGRLLLERYGEGARPEQTRPSWSMAKSMTHALAGLLAQDGLIAVDDPAAAPEWSAPDDPRAAITLEHLLRMSSGLRFVEDYVDGRNSDVLEMLYGAGKADTAAYAARLPLIHTPGTVWSYASGTTNILSRSLATRLGGGSQAFASFMRERLFAPLGMASAIPKTDAAGTFIGSSYCFCSARDFARFGLLYLRDGNWNGRRLLPEGWVDHARTPTPQPQDWTGLGYGAHWWLGLGGPGSFSANGFEGQFILCLPDCDGIIVRCGRTPLDFKDDVARWMTEVADALRRS
jgi:CubicO group peptidase (beta-lactamase class C family)